MRALLVGFLASATLRLSTAETAAAAEPLVQPLFDGDFHWTTGSPLVSPAERADDPCDSIKDPSIVQFDGRWHLFCTIRSRKRSHQIEYLNFDDWSNANAAPRHILTLTNGYFCAPQVFYFTPQHRWYLIYQVIDPSRKPSLQPACSTSTNLANPAAWSPPQLLFAKQPDSVTAWIDFWVICDETKARLFFTSNNGLMWRADTRLEEFPGGWSEPAVVLRGDIFEASHTYRLKDRNQYLTLVEAIGDAGRRYYQAYVADRLEGDWKPVAATRIKPFASPANVRDAAAHWTDSFSHGELLRAGHDEKMEVDPARLRFLYQGVSDARRAGKKYGEIPWELGLLEPLR